MPKEKHCSDCPYSSIINDADPTDWFCDDDVALVCTLKRQEINKFSEFKVDRQPFKPVTVGCRPYQIKKEDLIPKWCPLNNSNKLKGLKTDIMYFD